MFVNKLTKKQALQVFALLQIIIGIVYYLTVKGNFRYISLSIFVVLGLLIFICSFNKKIAKEKAVIKEKMTQAQKWD
ncbi:hypothetical protein PT285_03035 [Lactobacillus sp. ESL0791]|uniref:hypothetical protein n=1 Tax=Lactobacillus sp. ESL0791 TaxID=2983234 RepID=UPI0023F71006|nr:hypothetical protein [Lactobacillus sp. ESL0791]MDF7638409.1 hypothetical protein [Lactobacillus sp. ESL0791]